MDLKHLWVSLKRVVKSGFLNFWRNWFVTLSSILTMTITLFVVGMLVFAGVILNASLRQLQEKVDINVYFLPNAEEEDVLAIRKRLEALPEVTEVAYTSRDEALAAFRGRHQNDQLILQGLDELGENPLGAVLNIRARESTQYAGITKFLEGDQALSRSGSDIIYRVNFFQERYQAAVEKLNAIIAAGETIGFAIIIIFAVTTIMIMFNTVRLAIYTARDEIGVMRLVGASQMYIRGPFVFEGVLYGLCSALATLILFYPITYWLGGTTTDYFGGVNVFDYYLSNFALFFLLFVGAGVLLGAVASYLAVRRYLKI